MKGFNMVTNKSFKKYFLIIVFLFPFTVMGNQQKLAPNPDFLPDADSYTFKKIGNVNLRLHIFDNKKKSTEAKPGIIFFFGGGLMRGSITHFQGQAKALSRQGMIAVLADYRVKMRHGTGPREAISDAKDAISWLRKNASKFNLDPDKLVVGGGSSGGYLAASTATVTDKSISRTPSEFSSYPNALALFNPALGNRFPKTGHKLSPYQSLNNSSVPTFIVHGHEDELVPFRSAQAYCDKLNSLNGYCELHGYPGEGHGFFNRGRNGNKGYEDTYKKLEIFLRKFGYLK
jgi:acetyl esterase